MSTPSSPEKFGRYELLRQIAAGGMGEIYLARARGAGGFEKKVVIKRILPYLANESEFVAKFIDEANIVTHLTHGNIVPGFDMGEVGGDLYMAMEYIPGRDLRDILHRFKEDDKLLPIKVSLYIIAEACKGLGYAHRKRDEDGNDLNIIHRDVSPSNILISNEGEVKLVDFGIAKAAGRIQKSITGRLQGKFSYMSPEQATGKSLDKRSDIFSVAVVLYEMLTNIRPFEGETDLESLDLVRTIDAPPPSSHREEIPEAIDDIIMKALAKKPEDRFHDIDEMEKAIYTWLYANGGMTAREAAKVLRETFTEGLERDEGKMSLDGALASELDRLLEGSGSARTPSASGNVDVYGDTAVGDSNPGNTPSGQVGRRDETVSIVSDAPAHAEIRDSGIRITPLGGVREPAELERLGRSPTAPIERVTMDQLVTPAGGTDPGAARSSSGLHTLPPTDVTAQMDRRRRPVTIVAIAVAALLAGIGGFWAYQSFFADATITINSTPDGAKVFLDGREVGETPHKLTGVEPGPHEIKLRKFGFVEYKNRHIFDRGKNSALNIPMQEVAAKVAMRTIEVTSSPPGATVLDIEGRMLSEETTPVKVQIPVNTGTISLALKNKKVSIAINRETDVYHHDFSPPKVVKTVDAGEVDAAEADEDTSTDEANTEEAELAVVTFKTTPANANVRVNGQPVRNHRHKVRTNQLITVTAVAEGYENYSKQFKATGSLTWTIELKKSETTPDEPPKRVFTVQLVPTGAATIYCDWRINGRPVKAKKRSLTIDLPEGTNKVHCQATTPPGYFGTRTINVKEGTTRYLIPITKP